MEIYDTEEEQVEALKRWWKENGQATIIGIFVGIAIIMGWNLWKNYNKDRALQASSMYEALLKASKQGKTDSISKIAEELNEKFSGSAYSAYADLLKAKAKIDQKDLDSAQAILESLMKSADDEISQVARLRLVRILLAKGEYEKGLQLIAEVDSKAAAKFSGAYDELKGDLYLALDRKGEARTAYEAALRTGYQSPLLQIKLDDLTAAQIPVSISE